MNPLEFVTALKEHAWKKHKTLLFQATLDIIESFLSKKNLIVIEKSEYDALLKAAQDRMADKIISEILVEELITQWNSNPHASYDPSYCAKTIISKIYQK